MRSRNIPTYRRIHPHEPSPQCAASEGQTFECSPSPGMAADCRRKAPIRPAETLGKTGMTTFFAKKVILLLQSEKFVLFLNRDPPIGGRLRSNEILEDFRTTKRIAARRVVVPRPGCGSTCCNLRAWAFSLISLRASSKSLSEYKGSIARFFSSAGRIT